jgi:hypothetical protein
LLEINFFVVLFQIRPRVDQAKGEETVSRDVVVAAAVVF